jgi:ABC-type sugar transport system permease subunit
MLSNFVKHVVSAKINKFNQDCKNLVKTIKIFQNYEMLKLQNYEFLKCQNYEILLKYDINFFKINLSKLSTLFILVKISYSIGSIHELKTW